MPPLAVNLNSSVELKLRNEYSALKAISTWSMPTVPDRRVIAKVSSAESNWSHSARTHLGIRNVFGATSHPTVTVIKFILSTNYIYAVKQV